MPVTKFCQFQSEHRPVNTPESQFLDDMPSCDDSVWTSTIFMMYRDISKKNCVQFNRKDKRNQTTRKMSLQRNLADVNDSDTTSDQDDGDVNIEDNDACQ